MVHKAASAQVDGFGRATHVHGVEHIADDGHERRSGYKQN
jgi:hypothetical protein